jgi:hypothetical protein
MPQHTWSVPAVAPSRQHDAVRERTLLIRFLKLCAEACVFTFG